MFALYDGAIAEDECRHVVEESYELLGKTARLTHHLVPLAEMWSIERLRRMAVLDRRFAAAAPEVLFIDQHDTTLAPLAAALLSGYARGRVQVSSAGVAPGNGVDPSIGRTLAEAGLDVGDAFCKPVTDEATRAADRIVLIGPIPDEAAVAVRDHGADRLLRWEVGDVDGADDGQIRAVRDELDRRVLRLLADLHGPRDRP